MLEGEVVYRHADRLYPLLPGDSLFFDADAPHGPEELAQAADPLPVGHLVRARRRAERSAALLAASACDGRWVADPGAAIGVGYGERPDEEPAGMPPTKD